MKDYYTARANGLFCKVTLFKEDKRFESRLLRAGSSEKFALAISGSFNFEQDKLSEIKLEELQQKVCGQAVDHHVVESLQWTTVHLLIDLYERNTHLTILNGNKNISDEIKSSDPQQHSAIPAACFARNINVLDAKHIQPSDISAAVSFYDSLIEPSCKKLIELNNQTLQAERRERRKQALYRLGWVLGLSSFCVLGGLLLQISNLFITGGLMASFFLGVLLHNRLSPEVTLPKERKELFELNNKLRDEITQFENQHCGVLFRLLNSLNINTKDWKKQLQISKSQLSPTSLTGQGLYYYLDAMNFALSRRNELQNAEI